MDDFRDLKDARDQLDAGIFKLETYLFEEDLQALIENRDRLFLSGFRDFLGAVDSKLNDAGYRGYKSVRILPPYSERTPVCLGEKQAGILFSLKKATNFLRLYQSANIYTKPLLGYYAIYSLAQIQFDLTFEGKRNPDHGLVMKGDKVRIKKGNNDYKPFGLFQGFVDTTHLGRIFRVLSEGAELTYEELTVLISNTPAFDIVNSNLNPYFGIIPPDKRNPSYINIYTRTFLYFYLLSNFARYPYPVWQETVTTQSSKGFYRAVTTMEKAMGIFITVFTRDVGIPFNFSNEIEFLGSLTIPRRE